MVRTSDRELWKMLERNFESTHTCPVIIMAGKNLPEPMDVYKIYIDGNISKTRRKDIRPHNGEYIWLEPGEHRIVVREYEVKEVGRLESNTIHFVASDNEPLRSTWDLEDREFVISTPEPLHFEVDMIDGQLVLSHS